MATIDQVGKGQITTNKESSKEVVGYRGIVQFQDTPAAGGLPIPVAMNSYRQRNNLSIG